MTGAEKLQILRDNNCLVEWKDNLINQCRALDLDFDDIFGALMYDDQCCEDFKHFLTQSFQWANTPEDSEYWRAIAENN